MFTTRYRVLRREDGLYYPQLKKVLFWKDMTMIVYPRIPFIVPFTASISFTTEYEAITHINKHTRMVFKYGKE